MSWIETAIAAYFFGIATGAYAHHYLLSRVLNEKTSGDTE